MTQVQAALAKALGIDPALLEQLQGKKAKPAKRQVKQTKAELLAAKDASILATFKRRGIVNVVLMDRNDRTKAFNVRPFGRIMEDGTKTGWLAEGKVVKKGETSVRGLFHVSQTEDLPKAAE